MAGATEHFASNNTTANHPKPRLLIIGPYPPPCAGPVCVIRNGAAATVPSHCLKPLAISHIRVQSRGVCGHAMAAGAGSRRERRRRKLRF